MLVLLKQATPPRRAKYVPDAQHKYWVVWDTETKQRLYGPDTRTNCEYWRQKHG